MSASRYKPGRIIKTAPGAVRLLLSGRPLFVGFGTQGHERQMSPGFLLAWPTFVLVGFIKNGRVRAAVPLSTKKEGGEPPCESSPRG